MDGSCAVSKIDYGLRDCAQMYYETAQHECLSFRQLYRRIGNAQEDLINVGTGQDVADQMEAWIDGKSVDAFHIAPTQCPMASMISSSTCCPNCAAGRIRFRVEYVGRTLRENLGLKVP